jgi:hypothetical protein
MFRFCAEYEFCWHVDFVTSGGLCASIHIPDISVAAFRKSKEGKMEEINEERKEEKRDLLNSSIYPKTINDGKKDHMGRGKEREIPR